MSDFRFPQRIAGLRAQMATGEKAVDALVVSNVENARYLTGFTGSNALVIVTQDEALFLTDGRYLLQSATEVTGFERIILPQGTRLEIAAAEQLERIGAAKAGFEAGNLNYSAYMGLREKTPESVELIPRDDAVTAVRIIKDADEIAKIQRAVVLADECFDHIRKTARVGMTEKELVGSGPNSALIHGRAGDRVLGSSGGPELLLCDYGCELDGYNSDITRTFVVGGEPTDEQRHLYHAVQRAQQMVLDSLKPGLIGKDVHQIAVDSLTEDGYGDYFIHGLGHGLGRLVHDHVAFSRVSEVVLQPGMVVTVEPGAYIEGLGGVRIEDDVVITETGCQVLTQSTKELIVL
jgi:Xaa-Pro aminopeptidase